MAQVESVVEPDCVRDDIGWESVPFASIHPTILATSGSLLVSTIRRSQAARSGPSGRFYTNLDRTPFCPALLSGGALAKRDPGYSTHPGYKRKSPHLRWLFH